MAQIRKKSKINFIDLFCGCGGLSSGLEMSGQRCLLGVDFNKDAIETFKLNHPHGSYFCGDIRELTKPKLEKLININSVDLVVGGPPCQGFSTVGRGNVADQRNSLFKDFIRIVKIVDPKVVLFENVTGILAKKNKKVWQKILKSFENLGYIMDARVLAAEEYGVPSRRRRTIIMGTKKMFRPAFPAITHGVRGKSTLRSVGDVFSNLHDENGVVHNHDEKGAKIKSREDVKRLKHIPMGKGIRYVHDEEKYLPKRLRFNVDWEKMAENRFRQTKLLRLDLNSPAPTILTSRTSYYHPVSPRYLTVREAAACQSFPNTFIFTGSLTSSFRQIGNAVPPLLGKEIGEAIIRLIKKKSTAKVTKSILSRDCGRGAFNYDHQITM